MHHYVKTTRDKKDGPYDHRTLAFRNGERALHHIDKKAQGKYAHDKFSSLLAERPQLLSCVYLRLVDVVARNVPTATPITSPAPHHKNEPKPDDDCNSKNLENWSSSCGTNN